MATTYVIHVDAAFAEAKHVIRQLTEDQAGVVIGHLKSCRGQRANLIDLLGEAASDG